MPTIHIYHHGDTDGISAGACIYHGLYAPLFHTKLCYRLYNYETPLDFHNVKEDDIIFLVDYSLSNKDNVGRLRGLCLDLWKDEEDKHVFWFDHHKTSYKFIDQYPLNKISKIINTNICGAAISYLFCKAFYKMDLVETLDKYYDQLSTLVKLVNEGVYIFDKQSINNEFVNYVDSWDTWKHDRENDAAFNLGCIASLSDPTNDEFNHLLNPMMDASQFYKPESVEKLISAGETILAYNTSLYEQQMIEMAFECTIEFEDKMYTCLVYNGRGNSLSFGDNINKYDICAMMYFNGSTWFHSLYSAKVDTLPISEYMRGGGHPGASGFQVHSNKPVLTANKIWVVGVVDL